MPNFTQNWSNAIRGSVAKCFPEVPTDRPLTIVEIGSFEGRGSLALHELLCKHPDSKVLCIDPWDDGYVANFTPFQNLDPLFRGQFARFQQNTGAIPQIKPLRGTSNAVVPALPHDSIDFAYIDGDHSPDQVYLDGCMIFKKLRVGGFAVFDDYEWEHGGLRCRDGVDRFVREHEGRIRLLFRNYQLGIQKLS